MYLYIHTLCRGKPTKILLDTKPFLRKDVADPEENWGKLCDLGQRKNPLSATVL
jgi:hypothetical protein